MRQPRQLALLVVAAPLPGRGRVAGLSLCVFLLLSSSCPFLFVPLVVRWFWCGRTDATRTKGTRGRKRNHHDDRGADATHTQRQAAGTNTSRSLVAPCQWVRVGRSAPFPPRHSRGAACGEQQMDEPREYALRLSDEAKCARLDTPERPVERRSGERARTPTKLLRRLQSPPGSACPCVRRHPL